MTMNKHRKILEPSGYLILETTICSLTQMESLSSISIIMICGTVFFFFFFFFCGWVGGGGDDFCLGK